MYSLPIKHSCQSATRFLAPRKTPHLATTRSAQPSSFRHSNSSSYQSQLLKIRSNVLCKRYLCTKSDSEDQKSAPKPARQILSTDPKHNQGPTVEELFEKVRASDRKKSLLLTLMITAFLAVDAGIFLVWYMSKEDDPSSPYYIPSDWSHLVLTNLGLKAPHPVPAHFVGSWTSTDDELTKNITISPIGKITLLETDSDTGNTKIQGKGSITFMDEEYMTTKIDIIEKVKVDSPPVVDKTGSWKIVLDGKTYIKQKVHQNQSL